MSEPTLDQFVQSACQDLMPVSEIKKAQIAESSDTIKDKEVSTSKVGFSVTDGATVGLIAKLQESDIKEEDTGKNRESMLDEFAQTALKESAVKIDKLASATVVKASNAKPVNEITTVNKVAVKEVKKEASAEVDDILRKALQSIR
jgi:hypothetical protein